MGSPLKRMKHQHERDIALSQSDIGWLIQQAEYSKALAEKLDAAILRNRQLMSANNKLRNEKLIQ